MTRTRLAWRSLGHYWRTNLTVVLGVAVATAVLAGALIVGESVRRSLASLALGRLGATEFLVTAQAPVREALAGELSASATGESLTAVPLLTLEGAVTHDASGRRASRVAVYGVDDRFWRFHAVAGVDGPVGGAYASPALAAELGAAPGEALLVTVEAPSDLPPGVLQGRRSDRSRILRSQVLRVLPPEAMGEFSLRPTQAAVLAVFLPLQTLQRALDLRARVNALLIARTSGDPSGTRGPGAETANGEGSGMGAVRDALRAHVQLDDVGVRVRAAPSSRWVAIEARDGFVSDDLVQAIDEAARRGGFATLPVLTYLATTIRIGDREIPYSVVSGLDLQRYGPLAPGAAASAGPEPTTSPRLWLNEWAAGDLSAEPGDRVTLEYYLWSDEDGLVTASDEFTLAGIVPMAGAGGDAALIPEYPGLTDEQRMSDWDPPFPVDLERVRDVDEEYWKQYRTAPKAFVTLETAQRLWASRYGSLTSIRLTSSTGTETTKASVEAALRPLVDPVGPRALSLLPVRADAMEAARGTTDFGEYFLYFTFFLAVAALLLTGLLFRLSAELRLRELGLLRAVGFAPGAVRRLLLREGLLLAAAGSLLGLLGAIVWANLVMTGLRTWWFDAVGTDRLAVHVSWQPLAIGVVAGLLAGVATMWRTVASLTSLPPRTLLHAVEAPTGDETASGDSISLARRGRNLALGFAVGAFAVAGATLAGAIAPVAGFFGSGGLALLAGVIGTAAWFRRGAASAITVAGWWSIARLGFHGPRQRPGRAAAAISLIAFATFVIVAVGAFRRESGAGQAHAPGTGGYALIGESVLPLMHDPGTAAGRDALGLPGSDAALGTAGFTRLRLRAGDEASCLTLYRPTRPRIAGVPDALVQANRFPFTSSLAATATERESPWTLLRRRFADGAVPAIGDANSLTYVFHLGLGDTLSVETGSGQPVTLRIVGMLADSVFQSELLIADEHFVRLFPREEGFRLILVDTPPDTAPRLLTLLEDRLGDYGLDLQATGERLASYHRVENTYISTFQALGLLGLLLGTCGVGLMVLRGVIERRRELAVLRAVGYRRVHLSLMIVAESGIVAACGAGIGTLCALLATAPALAQHGVGASRTGMLALPALVVAVALLSALAAVLAAGRMPVAATIRSE